LSQETAWTQFGWQGIAFEQPADWNISVVEGDHRTGYVRLDDDMMVRMELRWEKPRRPADVATIVQRYLDKLERAARKAGQELTVRRHLRLVDLPGKDCEYLSTESDVHALALASRCQSCNRLVLARLLFRKGEKIKPVAQRLFSTFDDHPRDGKSAWGLYGLTFAVPEAFVLAKSALKTGYLELLFHSGREELEVIRYSMANVLLKSQPLADWFKRTYEKKLALFRCEVHAESENGHDRVRCFGPAKRRSILSALRRRRFLHCLAWRCREADKLFIFRLVSSQERDERFEQFSRSVACH